MGWGMGIGIGWPNVSTGSTPPPTVYNFDIYYCEGGTAPVYSLNDGWGPGRYIYADPALTIPYPNGIGAGTPPNFGDLLYQITTTGLITDIVIGYCEP